MAMDLRDKLRQLGVTKGKPPTRTRRKRPIESLLNGRQVESTFGRTFVLQERYTLDYLHGDTPLAALLDQPAAVAAQLGREPALAKVGLDRAVFLDTETTGLAGGTGTLAFLVGVGTFEYSEGRASQVFNIRQFFLRDPGEEPALLAALSEQVQDYEAIVTFNGRGFDLPLLQARYTLGRMQSAWLALPHLDLLAPARRLWRDRLPSCALASLEGHILAVQRTQDDVPGYLIPQMYVDYLQTGDAREMPRVLYHNRQDILSMVTLAARLCRLFTDPLADRSLDYADLVSLGKWYNDLNMHPEAEHTLRTALEHEIHLTSRIIALTRLGLLMKQQNRREEAITVWQQLAEADPSGIFAHIELAKHFEWHAGDLERALEWTQVAQQVITAWPPGYTRDQAQTELGHRLQRLERKRAKAAARKDKSTTTGGRRGSL